MRISERREERRGGDEDEEREPRRLDPKTLIVDISTKSLARG